MGVQQQQLRMRHIVAMLLGAIEALLLVRLLVQLLAARPDNPFMAAYLQVTAPLAAPLAFLDAGQPRYGATLDIATLTLALLLAAFGGGLWLLGRRRRRSPLEANYE